MVRNFNKLLRAKWSKGQFVCVGLDPDWAKVPEVIKLAYCLGKDTKGEWIVTSRALERFCIPIVDATEDVASAFKLNAAFFEAHGEVGRRALTAVIAYIRKNAPDVAVIYDAKRGDIGNTNEGYAHDAFDGLCADAITVHPTLGQEAMMSFLKRADSGVIVLCRTSNPGAGEFQDRLTEITWQEAETMPSGIVTALDVRDNIGPIFHATTRWFARNYQCVAQRVANNWNQNGNCAVVVGATYPEELAQVRAIVGNIPILIPGIGAQGGDIEKTVKAGKDGNGQGMIINSSRGIIHASSEDDFAEVARREAMKLHGEIIKHL